MKSFVNFFFLKKKLAALINFPFKKSSNFSYKKAPYKKYPDILFLLQGIWFDSLIKNHYNSYNI